MLKPKQKRKTNTVSKIEEVSDCGKIRKQKNKKQPSSQAISENTKTKSKNRKKGKDKKEEKQKTNKIHKLRNRRRSE